MIDKKIVDEMLLKLARDWEDLALSCDRIRMFGVSSEEEKIALLDRSRTLDKCKVHLKDCVRFLEEYDQKEEIIDKKKR